MTNDIFNGFSRDTVAFFEVLKENNNKEWFNENKTNFEQNVLEPARGLVLALGQRLKEKISQDIIADPRTDKSIFRLYRDTRFSKNKSPYKTHMGIFFWEGAGKKLENSGFYFHLSPPTLMLGVGMHMFPKDVIKGYREAVVAPGSSEKLTEAVAEVRQKKVYTIGGTHYKRIPSGFDPAHANAEFLRHNGFYAGYEDPIPAEFFSAGIVDFCLEKFIDMAPIHQWLRDSVKK
ncbi:MAG: DUF2461 domain-containing protein [bacterium]|nr:DUF2461 domain-containing protein [bacterium]